MEKGAPETQERPSNRLNSTRNLQVDLPHDLHAVHLLDFGGEFVANGAVDHENHEGLASLGFAADVHSGDVDVAVAKQHADLADDAGAVGMLRDEHVSA